MKKSTKENLQVTALALGSVPVAVGFIGLLAWLGLDEMKWFGVVLWTTMIFGVPVYLHPEDFKRIRCLVVFFVALAVHLAVLTACLRGVSGFPNTFFLFFSVPEIGIVATLLYFLGGAGHGRRRTHGARGRKDASDSAHSKSTEGSGPSESES